MSIGADMQAWIITKFLKSAYDKLEGKKTYVVMAVGLVLTLITQWNSTCLNNPIFTGLAWCKQITIPQIVYTVLFALGIITRNATTVSFNLKLKALRRKK